MTIRNDASRPFAPMTDPRRARSVVARQGQLLLDTDFNDLGRHLIDRTELADRDAMGSPDRLVVPADAAGFGVSSNAGTIELTAGRGYMAGWLVENRAACDLGTQPHPYTPANPAAPTIIALKALVRMIDPVEDPALADVALADAQASGRALVDWRAIPVTAAAAGGLTCAGVLADPAWLAMAGASTGTLAFVEQTVTASTDPCSLSPGGGYSRYENLLYRIEVHGGTEMAATADGPRFGLQGLKLKLSRRNASLMARITRVNGAELTVTPPALDARNWFAPGLYAEIVSTHDDISARPTATPERLFRVARAEDDLVTLVEIGAATVAASGLPATGLEDDHWFLRLWDAFPAAPGAAPIGLATVGAPSGGVAPAIDLGDGLGIQLSGAAGATYRRGDYWTCVVRADGSVAWPDGGDPDHFQVPHGPETRYAPLAIVTAGAVEDCRLTLATLTDRTLLYRGGDGQSIVNANNSGTATLPAKLRVAVMRGERPVVGAPIRWTFIGSAPAGTIAPATTGVTNGQGVVEVDWSVDVSDKVNVHQVQATLDDAPGVPPIVFSATVAAPADRNGCSTYVIVEGSDWVATLKALAPGEHASVCFQRGTYVTDERVVLEGLGHITLSGQGEATRILGRRGECVLDFRRCASVTIHDLRADTRDGPERPERDTIRNRDGTITIVDCVSVHVHHATLRCGGGITTERTCLSIRGNPEQPIKSAKIIDNRFLAGFLQDGLLVTDCVRVIVAGNEFTATKRSASITDARLLGQKTWQAMARKMLVIDPTDAAPEQPDMKRLRIGKFVAEFTSAVPQAEWDKVVASDANATVATAAEFQDHVDKLFAKVADEPTSLPSFEKTMRRLPQGSSREMKLALLAPVGITIRETDSTAVENGGGRVRIAVGNNAITFTSPLDERDWRRISDLVVSLGPQDYASLLHAVEATVARIVADNGIRARLPSADKWYREQWTPIEACARQAITCGGQSLGDVSVEGNRVEAYMQGVHVGTSAEDQQPVRLIRNARIKDNDLYLTKPTADFYVPFGLFLGNAVSGRVERNLLAPVLPAVDSRHAQGIRVWGHIGPFLMVRENHVSIAGLGIRVKPLDPPADGEGQSVMWLVADNLVENVPYYRILLAPSTVQDVNNRQT